jgi:hypothetical protein
MSEDDYRTSGLADEVADELERLLIAEQDRNSKG